MKVVHASSSASLSTKLYAFVGTSLDRAGWKVRWANDVAARTASIIKDGGNTDVAFVELDEPMTKLDGAIALYGFADYFEANAETAENRKAALAEYITKNGGKLPVETPVEVEAEQAQTEEPVVEGPTDQVEPVVEPTVEPVVEAPKAERKGRRN
jgi:hypothetical protein